MDETDVVEPMAIRHPKRGKAHRPVQLIGVNVSLTTETEATACDRWIPAARKNLTDRVPVAKTAAEDRCKRCFPDEGVAR